MREGIRIAVICIAVLSMAFLLISVLPVEAKSENGNGNGNSDNNGNGNGNENGNGNGNSGSNGNGNGNGNNNGNDDNQAGNNQSNSVSAPKNDKPKRIIITSDLTVRGENVIYDLVKPVVKSIIYVPNLTCVEVTDDVGIKKVVSGTKELKLWPGSWNWYCAKGPMDNIGVIDYAGNVTGDMSNSDTEVLVQTQTGLNYREQTQSFNSDTYFRFKNMGSWLAKGLYMQ